MAKSYLNIPIADMKAGDDVEGFFLLSGANVKTSAKGGQFLAGKLKDKSAEIFRDRRISAVLRLHRRA